MMIPLKYWLYCSYMGEYSVIWNSFQMVVFSEERILFLITGMFCYSSHKIIFAIFISSCHRVIFGVYKMDIYLFILLVVEFQLGAQMQILWVAAFFVALPLMIILHDVDVLTAECLFWSVILVGYE